MAGAQPVVGSFQTSGDPEAHILTATKRKPGLYKTFEDFRRNQPSKPEQGYTLQRRSYSKQYWKGGGEVQLVPTDSSAHSAKDLRRLYWGFMHDDTLYVAIRNLAGPFTNNTGYMVAYELGRYCVFRIMVTSDQAKVMTIALGTAGAALASPDGLDPATAILNMNNGVCYVADKSLMEKVLAKDPDVMVNYLLMLEKGSDAEGKAAARLATLHTFNERHAADVKF